MNKDLEKKQVVVFAGPSGSGKDTVMSLVMEKVANAVKLTTATTRLPREGEVYGKSYYFLSKEEFENGLENGMIPEHNFFSGNYYGTYLPDLEKKMNEG
jgi:guanylate kinase